MKNAVFAVLITFLAGISILFVVSSIGLFAYPKLTQSIEKISSKLVPKIPVSFSEAISDNLEPTPIPLTNSIVLAGINRIRLLANSQELKIEPTLCSLSKTALSGEKLDSKQIISRCPTCTQLISITFDRLTSLEEAILYLENDSTASAMVKNKKLNATCLAENELRILLIAAQKPASSTPVPQRIITEDELFNSLSEYRKDHGKKQLAHDDKLCEYARKRIQDQIKLLNAHKPKDDYPIPAKYPLDAHDGFKTDANTGFVFELTGRRKIAENLAYWPTAQYGVHVIEWGWDSSTEGHKETQLSDDYEAVCLSGSQGFFVATFGK